MSKRKIKWGCTRMGIKAGTRVSRDLTRVAQRGFLIYSPIAFHTPLLLLLYQHLLSFASFKNSILSPAPTQLTTVSLLWKTIAHGLYACLRQDFFFSALNPALNVTAYYSTQEPNNYIKQSQNAFFPSTIITITSVLMR